MRNRSEVLAAYHAYLDAFVASDEDAIHAQFVWPCAFIMDKETVMFDKFPFSPLEMKARKNWATSTSFEIDVIAVSESKAHLVLRNCDRLRPDGSLIENATAFYAFTKTPVGWKIFAMSAIEFPA